MWLFSSHPGYENRENRGLILMSVLLTPHMGVQVNRSSFSAQKQFQLSKSDADPDDVMPTKDALRMRL